MTLWQRLGRGARDRTYTATGVFLVEKEHFAEEREKKLKCQRARKAKRQNTPLQSITNKRVRTDSSTSQRISVENLEAIESSSEESEMDASELAIMQDLPVEPSGTTILELCHRNCTTLSTAPGKKSQIRWSLQWMT